jgi:type II secretory ATPase GspE/PulE/Tfp pilus assembly ATPase PilB-like protein
MSGTFFRGPVLLAVWLVGSSGALATGPDIAGRSAPIQLVARAAEQAETVGGMAPIAAAADVTVPDVTVPVVTVPVVMPLAAFDFIREWLQARAKQVASSKDRMSEQVMATLLSFLCGLLFVIIFFWWVRSADWVNQDRYYRRESKNWNLAMVLPFAICFPLSLFLATISEWLLLPLQFLAWLVPFVVYVAKRNPTVPVDDKVFTQRHLRRWTAQKLALIGIKIRTEDKSVDDIGPPLKFMAHGGATERDDSINLLTARQAPGYLPAREVMAQGIDNRAGSIMLDYTQQAVAVRFQVDGVWHPGESLEREPGDMLLAVLKVLCALNPNERRARQQGRFGVEYQGQKHQCRFMSQGTKTGERVLVLFEDPDVRKKRPPDLGMRQKMLDELEAQLRERTGIVVLSAPPGAGLTTLVHAVVGAMDRYTRGFVDIEDVATKDVDIENVVVTTFNSAAGETPLTVLPKIIRGYPDVFVVPDLRDAETAELICDQMGEDRMAVTSTRAKEAAESLLRVLAVGAPADKMANAFRLALNMRLVRKLCDKCKEAYPPPPQLLQQLGIPAGRVEALYRPPTPNPEQPQEPCAQCRGIGYFGRTGIFELLIVEEQVRQAIIKKPQVEVVRQAARKAGMRTLQEEGLLLVVTGVTSLPELMRALKE